MRRSSPQSVAVVAEQPGDLVCGATRVCPHLVPGAHLQHCSPTAVLVTWSRGQMSYPRNHTALFIGLNPLGEKSSTFFFYDKICNCNLKCIEKSSRFAVLVCRAGQKCCDYIKMTVKLYCGNKQGGAESCGSRANVEVIMKFMKILNVTKFKLSTTKKNPSQIRPGLGLKCQFF